MEDKRIMKDRYLEVTFSQGKALAAYLYLPRNPGEKSQRTEKAGAGMLIDYGDTDQPIGIEITAPQQINLEAINRILAQLGLCPLEKAELAPLLAA